LIVEVEEEDEFEETPDEVEDAQSPDPELALRREMEGWLSLRVMLTPEILDALKCSKAGGRKASGGGGGRESSRDKRCS
jgi:hypothetical protein